MKRLIVCLDGTWNTPDDKKHPTNVVKIMRAIRHADENGVSQVTFYDKGVGTGNWLDRLQGGAFGRGLGDNVKDGYRFLANNYVAGDEIYLFGFSRGAFTCRSLAGFIGVCGLLDKHTMGRLEQAWKLYRTPKSERDPDAIAEIRATARTGVPIRCIGVWDTVGALGIPVERLRFMNRGKYAFHDTNLGTDVACALHAMAIDEARGPFAPTLWQAPKPPSDQIVEQVWFPGVHSNVGGSYDDPGLSDLALDWMIKRVRRHTTLAFDDAYLAEEIKPDAKDTIYESRTALYTISRWIPYQRVLGGRDGWVRRFLRRSNRPRPGHQFLNEAIHQGALDRLEESAPFQDGSSRRQETYQPAGLVAASRHLPVIGHDGNVAEGL